LTATGSSAARSLPEKEVWEAALIEGLVVDVPVADEEGGQILPRGYRVRQIEEPGKAQPDWKPHG